MPKRKRNPNSEPFLNKRTKRLLELGAREAERALLYSINPGRAAELATDGVVDAVSTISSLNSDKNLTKKMGKQSAQLKGINLLAQRSRTIKTGDLSLKRGKKVKVSRKLREKVEEVIEDNKHHGTFVEKFAGIIARIWGDNDDIQGTCQVDGMPNQITRIWDGKTMPFNSCGWFSDLMPFVDFVKPATGESYATQRNALETHHLHFFTPLQVWDMLSKQYGEKLLSQPPSNTGNNFWMTQHTEAHPTAGTRGSRIYNVKGLKIKVERSYVELLFHSQSQRHVTLEIFACVPKRKVGDGTPLHDFRDGLVQFHDEYANNVVTLQNKDVNTTTFIRDAMRMADVEPNLAPKFKANWSYERTVIQLAPGERTTTKINGMVNTEYDFTKLEALTSDVGLWGTYKGLGVYLMIRHVVDDQLIINSNVNTDVTAASWTAESGIMPQPGFTGKPNEISCPIFVQAKAYTRYCIPDSVGGITESTAAAVPGKKFNLTERKDKFTLYDKNNYVLSQNNANFYSYVYDFFDEENPALEQQQQSFRT